MHDLAFREKHFGNRPEAFAFGKKENNMTIKVPSVSRRSLFRGLSLAAGWAGSQSLFVKSAQAAVEAQKEWTGYTICDSCNHVPQCGIKFHARGNTIIRIENWKENPRSILCSKGLSTLQRLYNPNRLLYPLKRTNPKGAADPGWVRITWEEAYKTIAARMLEIRRTSGPNAVMFYAGDPKEPRPAIYRLARYFGSTTYGTESSVGCRSGCMMVEELNFGRPNNGGLPTPDTKVFMIMATNVWAQPLTWWKAIQAAKARGCKIITIDSRRTKAAEIADIHLQPRIGTDAALVAGMMRVLIREGLYDKAFVEKWTYGFEAYREYCETFTPQYTEEITGVPAELVVEGARLWAKGPGTFSLTTQSVSHNSNGVNNARALLLLPIVMGYIDVKGGVAFPSGPKGLAMAAYGLHPSVSENGWFSLPEQKKNRLDREELPLWNDMKDQVSPNNFPEWVDSGKVRMLCGWGFNVNIWPSPQVYAAAVKKLDFAFSADYFYRPDSHQDMDIILPAAMNYERYAPFGWYGNKIAVRKPVKPLGECREDWRIAFEIGAIVDKPEHFFDGDPKKACDHVLKSMQGEGWEAFADALPRVSSVPAPKPALRKYETGGMRPDGKPGFNTLSGKLEFSSVRAEKFGHPALPIYKPMMPLTKEFNLRFLNGARKPFITHSKTRSDQPYLLEIEDHLTIDISPEDAAERGIREGDIVEIRSPYGGPVEARAMVSIIVPKGLIDAQYGWLGKENTQPLVGRAVRDPMSGYPAYFEMPVSVTKKA